MGRIGFIVRYENVCLYRACRLKEAYIQMSPSAIYVGAGGVEVKFCFQQINMYDIQKGIRQDPKGLHIKYHYHD